MADKSDLAEQLLDLLCQHLGSGVAARLYI